MKRQTQTLLDVVNAVESILRDVQSRSITIRKAQELIIRGVDIAKHAMLQGVDVIYKDSRGDDVEL